MTCIILASGSAIRKQILEGAGITFEVITKPVDEAAIKSSMLSAGILLTRWRKPKPAGSVSRNPVW